MELENDVEEQKEYYSTDLGERLVEKWIFSRRTIVLTIFLSITLLFAWMASKLEPDASLERMIPLEHPYIKNFTCIKQVFEMN